MVEDNARDFAGTWYGTGAISGTGDAERIELDSGEYMQSEIVDTGDMIVELIANKYQAGGTFTVKYRTAASPAAVLAASWSDYSVPFASSGYTQARVEY